MTIGDKQSIDHILNPHIGSLNYLFLIGWVSADAAQALVRSFLVLLHLLHQILARFDETFTFLDVIFFVARKGQQKKTVINDVLQSKHILALFLVSIESNS